HLLLVHHTTCQTSLPALATILVGGFRTFFPILPLARITPAWAKAAENRTSTRTTPMRLILGHLSILFCVIHCRGCQEELSLVSQIGRASCRERRQIEESDETSQ